MSLHPGNTLTKYITALPQRVRLEGQRECGLVEIQYPHSWYNVSRENAWFAVVSGSDHSVIRRGRIETGYYDRPEKLIGAINKILTNDGVGQGVTLTYSKIPQKVTARLDPGVIFTMDMQKILGFDQPFLTETTEAQSVVNMAQGFSTRCTSTLTS